MSLTTTDSTLSATPSPKRAAGSGRTAAPTEVAPAAHSGVATFAHLIPKLEEYLTPSELKKVKEAYRFADEMHLGQMRKSGEPYISHPLAVAEICAEWKLDAQAMMAAFLHDVMEDQGVKKEELIERFGASVASLVDGLSKLDKIEFQSQVEAQAENFRKMLLAMARDVRVILVKLADRLHNMRTLGSMPPEKKRRISRETMEVYVPIAHRLGLNNIYRELQELSFAHLHPLRHRTLSKAVKAARGNRREVVTKIMESVTSTLIAAGIPAQVDGREKTLYGIYRKMRNKHLSFSQVLDVYGFRVVVDSFANCYVALGTLHSLFKPMPGKFKDYIAIPKLNGYQSLHTTLIGPYGTPVEFQIRTSEMHRVAESGVAAHWLYKDDEGSLTDLQQRTHAWLQSLLDIQKQTGDSAEFLEHVKVDLFPDSVYVFTPKSKIIALPRGATALDFAYSIHTDIGDQTTSAIINHEPAPLRAELHNGDIVEIITSPTSRPSPNWLGYVRTGKARSAIRHRLRTANQVESQAVGRRLLGNALHTLGIEPELPSHIVERLLNESSAKTMDDLYAEIGIGTRMAPLVARHIMTMMDTGVSVPQLDPEGHMLPNKPDPVVITGSEGASAQLSSCCMPIPGDRLTGYLKADQTLIVHTQECDTAKRLHEKEPDRWIELVWGQDLNRRFDCRITILIHNERGTLARIAAEIGESDANIVSVAMDDEGGNASMKYLRFTIQVEDRVHLARTMRGIRRIDSVARILRERG
ncbi:bifunctional (p)ppGpp synthetase/guanosine-3',5'-bis(diphosphate) 3'-pyrophosphohydrolase [Herbaspirillum seropedicae]|uniref:Bifunctional enzyme: (P)ppGpp synthetase II/guanosine-3',5'-bis pyrophosphate 3'-pyrophosphohydrolase protein n=1 Tax=Herbaspirillum seropedicae (strain SmR1) TaxID=757424 RepID=D8IT69_HERSS|nr:bifunctional (p)ppGpp synthetase/guanosine-3',5'-bis(diphosphate) 3'-pyrophosphohydrolase [Herbaspirillum seropedicae]ADJ63628.1 bifunctional enzyme: (P)ppGpp synthetase II/guanosine-3',5'-bis pyrophosphate 3'-pyrophosphohydrolase protein [Herbaspirillum seropedicae SmR1]AKN65653.1 guanosine-3',5'-bis(diphosphate) 3'-pyrophosphohydrolase [Herbaspirillum seropedicae]AON54454.1 bifunctional (P)ppGpp synthetase II/guanosine-3',5'-bis pyrophosphate 3'-pyrophosphohydrolase [Herbaspirillum seropedi